MRQTTVTDIIRRTIHWLLLALTVIFLITGFGITEFRIVEAVTLGWLTKSWALRIHDSLWIPFVVLLVLHLCLPFIFKRKTKGVEL